MGRHYLFIFVPDAAADCNDCDDDDGNDDEREYSYSFLLNYCF